MLLEEKYARFMTMVQKYRDEIQSELIELGLNNSTREEREYQNDLMGEIEHANDEISLIENRLKRLKRSESSSWVDYTNQ